MLVAWAAHELEKRAHGKVFSRLLRLRRRVRGVALCSITFTSYVKELRGAEMKWDKTEKTGKVLT